MSSVVPEIFEPPPLLLLLPQAVTPAASAATAQPAAAVLARINVPLLFHVRAGPDPTPVADGTASTQCALRQGCRGPRGADPLVGQVAAAAQVRAKASGRHVAALVLPVVTEHRMAQARQQ